VGGATVVIFSYRWRTVCKSSSHWEETSQTLLTNKKQGKIRLWDRKMWDATNNNIIKLCNLGEN
jgi:hypothetical protein